MNPKITPKKTVDPTAKQNEIYIYKGREGGRSVSLFYIPIRMFGRGGGGRTAAQGVDGGRQGTARSKPNLGRRKHTKRNNVGLPQCVPHD